MKLVWTPRALADLDEAAEYIAQDNPQAADRLVRRIEERVLQLQHHPELGRPGHVDGTRELVVTRTRYIVAYRVADKRIDVLAVLHGARRWPNDFESS